MEAGFRYGFPNEEEEDLNLTLNMMLKGAGLGLWFPEIGILNVENGTELYDDLKDEYESYLFRKNKPSTFQGADGIVFSGIIKNVSNSGSLQVLLENDIIKDFDFKTITLLY